MSNLFLFIVIASFYNVYILTIYLLFLIYIHFILYTNGLLGKDVSNILSYLVGIMNLGETPNAMTTIRRKIECIGRVNQFLISFLYGFAYKINFHYNYLHFLSYFFLLSRVTQGVVILIITLIIDSLDVINNDHFELKYIFMFVALVCYVLSIVFYVSFHDGMNLGKSIERNVKILTINYQFADAVRLIKFEHRIRDSNSNSNSNSNENTKRHLENLIMVYKKLLTIIIEENIPLLIVNKIDLNSNRSDVNDEHEKEHEFLINEINYLVSLAPDKTTAPLAAQSTTPMTSPLPGQAPLAAPLPLPGAAPLPGQAPKGRTALAEAGGRTEEICGVFLRDILQLAIENSHETMILFLLTNAGWIKDIRSIKFEGEDNILAYLLKHCLHKPSIIKSVIIDNKYHYEVIVFVFCFTFYLSYL